MLIDNCQLQSKLSRSVCGCLYKLYQHISVLIVSFLCSHQTFVRFWCVLFFSFGLFFSSFCLSGWGLVTQELHLFTYYSIPIYSYFNDTMHTKPNIQQKKNSSSSNSNGKHNMVLVVIVDSRFQAHHYNWKKIKKWRRKKLNKIEYFFFCVNKNYFSRGKINVWEKFSVW